jgi:hypothetical protein
MSHPSNPLPPGTVGGVLVLIVCCLLSSIRILLDSPGLAYGRHDDVEKRSDQRFAALKQQLPTAGIVGYIGDPADSTPENYYLTQYALAPLVVDASIGHKLVVGNFPSGQIPASLPGLREVQNFGHGVVLLTTEGVH